MIRLGVVRGISYGLFGPPGEFGPQARALGAGLIRAYIYWGQVEPRPGEYVWNTVDALMKQLDGAPRDEAWITIVSSSRWATRVATDFLPPSPARSASAYASFVRALVARCGGRVRLWQCDNEPSNVGLTWSGTASEYVAQLQVMHAAVKSVDPSASVVLGGCGYDVLSSPPGSPQRAFFSALGASDAYDLFSVNLYGDPSRVPDFVAQARGFAGDRPVVAGEHGGPVIFEFPEVEAALGEVMAADPPASSYDSEELRARMASETPERRAMAALYARMDALPESLQMFMAGCRPELEAKRHRIAARQLVMRTLLALSCGVERAAYWCLAPEVPGEPDHLQMMHLLTGKLALLDYDGAALDRRHPAADAFALLTGQLAGATRVVRVEVPGQPSLYAFHVTRSERPPLLVLWERRDTFTGEDSPAVDVTWPWTSPSATAVDVFGDRQPAFVDGGEVRVPVSATPVFVE